MDETHEFYNLHDLTQGMRRDLAPGLNSRIFVGDQSMLSVVSFEPHAEGRHCHINWGGRKARPALGWPDAPAFVQASPLST